MGVVGRLEAVTTHLAAIHQRGWIVGGAVRDAIMDRPIVDVDIALAGDAAEAASALARSHRASKFPLSDAFGAWRVQGGRLPFQVDITPLQGTSIDEDLSRRDLTVNAMAVPLGGGDLLDPAGGRGDLDAGVLRMVSAGAFHADPVRIVRLARLGLQFDWQVDEATRLRARMDAGGLARSAGERIYAELIHLVRRDDAWRGLERLDDVGGLGVIVPELEEGRGLEQTPYHHKDVLGHTLEVVQRACEIRQDPAAVFRGLGPQLRFMLDEPLADEMTRGDVLMFSCLLHDMAKPATYAVTPEGRATFMSHDRLGADLASDWCLRMGTAKKVRTVVTACVRQHLALGFMVHRQPLSLRQIVRYLDRTRPAQAELLILSCADRLATNGPRTTPSQIARHLDVARQIAPYLVRFAAEPEPDPLLDGNELAERVGRRPGPWTSDCVAALREEQLVGMVRTREQAERFVDQWAARNDLPKE